ncbi:MAG: pyridoxamine 5'-phosphate oxidase family protein [Nocardioidaceae bacterium]|nr:pyridoxamine 5'-phosphate oxidase family protein [Nocardioidaceae bacterium]NUS51352.1 pyridoxamine 5'-phosphate oxidase family protein [Nocardioidaceae bacterium]
MTEPARTREQRLADARYRLEHDVDVWVASAGPDGGAPYLTPLSFLWDGEAVLLSTPATSPTGRNLAATGTVRLGFGLTRDVVLVEGDVTWVEAEDIDPAVGDAFAAKSGFDPRDDTGYRYFRVAPTRVTAWREVNELRDRVLMRDGAWLT